VLEMVALLLSPRAIRWIRRVFPSLPCILVSFSASAQIVCGNAPKDVPVSIQEQLKGDVDGQAQALTKLIGTAQIKGAVETSRTEIYEAHKNLDRHQIDMYFLWVSCQTISSDKNMATADKLTLWENVVSVLGAAKDAQVTITGGDNVVSVGQIAGITARTVTVINPPVMPELRMLGRQDADNPDGSHTAVIRTAVAAPVTPGLLIIQIQASGLRNVKIAPPAVGGIAMMTLRNVVRSLNAYSAEIPSPKGEYDISVTTAGSSDVHLAASF
jgi:hypothetical protein